MSPTKIMIIRHAEKPTQDGLIGIAADGQPDPESLSQIGWDRARKLVDFFARPTAANIERPDAIFAAAPEVGSKRPVETVIPLVEALHMGHFNTSIRKDNVHHLASAVMATNGVILVCWEHTLIPAAIQALPNPPPTTPTKWPGSRFDVVWILNAKPDGGWDLHQTPQMLLPSDQASVIPPHPNIQLSAQPRGPRIPLNIYLSVDKMSDFDSARRSTILTDEFRTRIETGGTRIDAHVMVDASVELSRTSEWAAPRSLPMDRAEKSDVNAPQLPPDFEFRLGKTVLQGSGWRGITVLLGTLIAAAALTQLGPWIWSQVLPLLGLKLGAGVTPASASNPPTDPVEEIVECSVFGPPSAPPDATILIQVFLHLANQAERASFLATTMDSSAKLKATKSLDLPLKRGAQVEIAFSANGLVVDDPVQIVVWRGEPAYCQFLATIPAGTRGQSFFPVIRVSVDGKLVGPIKFRLSSDDTASQPVSEPLGDHAKVYKYAFVSYASKDREEVLKRVQMLEILKTKFFQDILSLDPGDRWEKKLYENIDRCDLFLLFWSQAAKDSQWVLKEAEYALAHQQKNPGSEPDLVPVVLEQNVLPPPNLSAFHFNDRISYLISRKL